MDSISEYFLTELNLIKSESIRDFTTRMLDVAPPYFSEVPSSSTGKYHPEQSLGQGGLLRHTQAVVYMANELCRSEDITGEERDAVIAACLLHDIVKYGLLKGKHTTQDHDYVGAYFINAQAKKMNLEDTPMLKEILGGIAWHMGIWSKRFNGQAVKKYPDDFTRVERIVHLADYIASRKELMFNFLEEKSFIG